MTEIITRLEAKGLGLRYYFTCKPCKHGHVAMRTVGNGHCMDCNKLHNNSDYQKIYHQNNRDRRNLSAKQRYLTNRDQRLATAKAWRKANPGRRAAMAKRYRAKSPRLSLLSSLSRALRRRPTDNPVTVDELIAMWCCQNGCCAMTGAVMTWAKGSQLPTSISIDRKDCLGGYTLSNVRLVCTWINSARGTMPDQELFERAVEFVAFHRSHALPIGSGIGGGSVSIDTATA